VIGVLYSASIGLLIRPAVLVSVQLGTYSGGEFRLSELVLYAIHEFVDFVSVSELSQCFLSGFSLLEGNQKVWTIDVVDVSFDLFNTAKVLEDILEVFDTLILEFLADAGFGTTGLKIVEEDLSDEYGLRVLILLSLFTSIAI